MSHHFSPEFTVLPPGKEPVSKKLQRNNEKTSSARQKESQKLDFDNKQMEWKLNQLKQAMSKEKEDRGKQASIWKSGNARIESHSRNILGRTVSATVNGAQRTSPKSGSKSAPKSKQPGKVRILRDEPLDLPQRDSRTKDLIKKLQEEKPPVEEPRKTIESTPRKREYWINFAFDRNSDDVLELQSDLDGNLPLTVVQAMEPSAIGVYFVKWGRKRLLIAGSGVIRKPKTGWGDEVYYPYVAKLLPDMPMKPEPPLRNVSNTLMRSPELKENRSNEGGLLLQGSFDEEKNAESFQRALNEWRVGKIEKTEKKRKERKLQPEMSVHVAQCTPEPFEVKFSETSTLSYMEQVLLQKHRTSQVPAMPKSLIDTVNGHLEAGDVNNMGDDDGALTMEEEEERQRYRQLFTPEPASSMASTSVRMLSISEINDEDDAEATDLCFVDESPPTTPVSLAAPYNHTIVIEEINYDVTQCESDFQSKKAEPDEVKFPENISKKSLQSDDTKKSEYSASKQQKVDQFQVKSEHLEIGEHSKLSPDEKRSKSAHNEERSDENELLSHKSSSLVHEISKIPINPDALYHRGLNDFFGDVSEPQKHMVSAEKSNQDFPIDESEIAKHSHNWDPLSSIVNKGDVEVENDHYEETKSTALDAIDNRPNNITPAVDSQTKSSPAEESEQYDSKSLSDNESADERALDDLEWELASRTGNLTADGRISRLIDEWSQNDDLEIIDDPGDGSGLSTPDVRSNSISKVSVTDPNDPRLQYDFRNMEQLIMADLSGDYSEEELL